LRFDVIDARPSIAKNVVRVALLQRRRRRVCDGLRSRARSLSMRLRHMLDNHRRTAPDGPLAASSLSWLKVKVVDFHGTTAEAPAPPATTPPTPTVLTHGRRQHHHHHHQHHHQHHKWRVAGWAGRLCVKLREEVVVGGGGVGVGGMMDGKGTLKMFTRKKRELIKTPSISKKSRSGSPAAGPQSSSCSVSSSSSSSSTLNLI